ncbi:hypothetical protein HZB02_04285 [Candidatus Woesearchaeota archaeon]|nr:hypothetical protein [Candidatus Woesearchaeota archaeon]
MKLLVESEYTDFGDTPKPPLPAVSSEPVAAASPLTTTSATLESLCQNAFFIRPIPLAHASEVERHHVMVQIAGIANELKTRGYERIPVHQSLLCPESYGYILRKIDTTGGNNTAKYLIIDGEAQLSMQMPQYLGTFLLSVPCGQSHDQNLSAQEFENLLSQKYHLNRDVAGTGLLVGLAGGGYLGFLTGSVFGLGVGAVAGMLSLGIVGAIADQKLAFGKLDKYFGRRLMLPEAGRGALIAYSPTPFDIEVIANA